MKHIAKKRETLAAVQWLGDLTPEITAFLQGRAERFAVVDGRLEFVGSRGPGRIAERTDWIVWSSEGLIPVGDAHINTLYDEVDEAGRPLPPTAKEHEAAGYEFAKELDTLLVSALKLSAVDHATIFRDRDRLMRTLRGLLEDHGFVTARRERQRILDRLAKETL